MPSSALARSRKSKPVQERLCEALFRPAAHVVVRALLPLRVPPPAVVLLGAAAGVAGAVELARGHLVVAALLVQLKTVLDNADGQLARLSGRVSLLGRYLDSESDLLVNAALFAGLGSLTGHWALSAAGLVALTAVLSLNFNLERLYRAAPRQAEEHTRVEAVLARVYAAMYGWQDALVDRAAARLRPDRLTVGAFAQLGMSSQLLVFGVCVAAGHPLVAAWVAIAQLPLAAVLVARCSVAPSLTEQEGTA